jgi:two-component system KDP operon response regulator KdpE
VQQDTTIAFVTYNRPYPAGELLATLARFGFATMERPYDPSAVSIMRHVSPTLVILALRMDEPDQVLLREVRSAVTCPILVLVPEGEQKAQAVALELGADACLTDGVQDVLLQAQIRALRRHRGGGGVGEDEPGASLLRVRDITLDFDRCQASMAGDIIPLTPTEFKILAFLARNAGKVVSPSEILRSIQDYSYSDREAQEIVKVYIRRIRRKIESDASEPDYIVNVRGFGYMLERRSGRRADSFEDEPVEFKTSA